MADMAINSSSAGRNTSTLLTLVQKLREQRLAQTSPEQRSKIELGEILSKTSASFKDSTASGD